MVNASYNTDPNAWMDDRLARRSLRLTDEEALAGEAMVSIETQTEFNEAGFQVYSRDHFDQWIRTLRMLSGEQQEMLLSYYILSKPQNILAKFLEATQTVISFRLRLAVKLVGAYVLWGGPPSEEIMHQILTKAGLEESLASATPRGKTCPPLSTAISQYARCLSFERVAVHHGLHRPEMRRAMSRTAKFLLGQDGANLHCHVLESTEIRSPEETALGAYIFNLIDKAHASAAGKTPRQLNKTAGSVFLKDPDCLGQFRVDVSDPGWSSMFSPSANSR
jgi:hypothetical protein